MKAIEVDILQTGAFELYKPLYYSIAGSLVFALASLLGFAGQNFKLVGLLGVIASAIAWVFSVSKLTQFGGYVIFLIFSPYVVIFYFVPILFLIIPTFLSIRLLIGKSDSIVK